MKCTIISLFSTKLGLILLSLLTPFISIADEGMWLISQISKNIVQMQELGLKLSEEDIYSINNSSLKDAIVQLDDGSCTGELISSLGLVLTNHHCAVSDIQYHSTATNNLLQNGYWAADYASELPVPGKSALILNRVEDVTARVLNDIEFDDPEYFAKVMLAGKQIATEVEKKQKGVVAEVIPMYNSNQFYLFVYNRFTDVRLVGAPPSSIGNFGGDIDNWRWPRHTGDFALFRIYASPDGLPADYSKRNVPYKPKNHLKVSLKGVDEDDFAMVIGYPGTTYRYSTSFHAAHERDIVAPWVSEVWGGFISIIKEAMATDSVSKVNLTDKHDMLVNFWQKDTYQANSMNRFSVVERFSDREEQLKAWTLERDADTDHYNDALNTIEDYYNFIGSNNYEELYRSLSSLLDWPVEIGGRIYELHDLIMELVAEKPSKRRINRETRRLKANLSSSYQNYNSALDAKLYATALLSLLKYFPEGINDPMIDELKKTEYPDLFIPYIVNYFFEKSIFTSQEKLTDFLRKPISDSLYSDPLFLLHLSYENLISYIQLRIEPRKSGFKKAVRDLTKGYLELEGSGQTYPDANSTMRVSYGKVKGYYPRDGIRFKHMTYLDGKIEKENPLKDVFRVDPRIKELWESKKYEPYNDSIGLPLCFLTDNDITGGNSGSPVLNAEGYLIGVAFDGNYEAMACDFMFEPEIQRTIVTDIRYVLFVIDYFAGAKRLINEMTIVGEN